MITIENKKILARQIEEIIKEAGQFILHHKIEKVMEKGNASNVVTNIDIQCQNLIIEKCKKVLPDSVFLAEEEGQQQIDDGWEELAHGSLIQLMPQQTMYMIFIIPVFL